MNCDIPATDSALCLLKSNFPVTTTHRQSEYTASYKNPHPHISTIGFFLGLTLQRKFFPSWKFPFSESNDPLGFRFRSHALPNRVTYSFTSRSRSGRRRRTMNATFALFKKNLRVVLRCLFVYSVVLTTTVLWILRSPLLTRPHLNRRSPVLMSNKKFNCDHHHHHHHRSEIAGF